MAYLALARKYRPQRFADMIGQEHVTRTLENAIKTDRVHHAYLFCGVRGLGKTTAARILAKCLVCERGPTPEPCNQCEQCRAINEGRSVDVIEIDGASNNSVEDVRSLREQVHYLPQSARRKIYIIDEVHMLTQQAFNALLKTLEEPPPHVTFMFATTDPHKVLPTILSRVSRLDYRRVRASTLVPYLQQILTNEGFAVEEEGLYVIARCGEGSVRDSLTLLDKVLAFAADPKAVTAAEVLEVLGQASRTMVAELVQAVLDRDAAAVLERFERITQSGSDLMQLALAILQHLRDLTVIKLTGTRSTLLDMSDDLFDQLVAQAEQTEAIVLAQHFDRFTRVLESLENSRVPKLVIEMGLLELVQAEPLLPLGDLVERLDALASGRPMSGGSSSGSGTRSGGRAAPGGRPAGPTPRRAEVGADADERPRLRAVSPAEASEPAAPSPAPPPPSTPPTPAPRSERPTSSAPASPAPAPAPTGGSAFENQLWEMYYGAGSLPPASATPRVEEATAPYGGETSSTRPSSRPSTSAPASPPSPQPPARPVPASANEPAPEPSRSRPVGETIPRLSPTEPPPDHPAMLGFSPTDRPRVEPPPTPARPEQPASTKVGFELSNDAVRVEPPVDRDAGCPSSRCIPRDAIAWQQMQPWDAWEALLEHIAEDEDNPLLVGMLRGFGLVELAPGVVRVAAPANGFPQLVVRENPELKVTFERLTGEYFGEPMRLELVDATPTLPELPSLELVEQERKRRHEQQVHSDAHSHPRLRALLHAFGGRLEQIKVIEQPRLPPPGQRGLPG